jgi:alpha-tubulin suppressor-like RCC1 family protein
MARTWSKASTAAATALLLACGGGKKGDEVASCDPGWHECGPGDCALDTSPQSCGSRCTPCPAPDHGSATCAAAACGFACAAGHHACGAACAEDVSPDSCGTSCTPCAPTQVAHAHTACVSGGCDYLCDQGYAKCTTGCCPPPAAGLARLAAGEAHTCGVTAGGELKCWGQNAAGQLGDGSTSERLAPVLVAGSGTAAVRQVGTGWRHTLAVDASGNAGAWGSNWAFQVDQLVGDRLVPDLVQDLPGAALWTGGGWAHSCALLANGQVLCWGNGEVGQLGNGLAEGGAHGVPAPVLELSGAFALLSGYKFSCALTDVTTLRCWGHNGSGQLGDPAAGAMATRPVTATTLAGVTALRAVALGQEHACAAYDAPGAAGRVRCWGRGEAGQLGNGTTPASQLTPVEVLAGGSPLSDVVALTAGWSHTCALTSAGSVRCWGDGTLGQLGDGGWAARTTAVEVRGLPGVATGLVAGWAHTCALVAGTSGERLHCWGDNNHGQLGDGTRSPRNVPTLVPGF